MSGLAQQERHALSDTLARVGPQGPTLCAGWQTRDLAAHLVARERRPDSLPGTFLSTLEPYTQRVQDGYAEQIWDDLVEMFRQGPRGWLPTRMAAVDDAVNLAEFFVHHEDVLRADPAWTPEQARIPDPAIADALWGRLRQVGQLLFRRSPVGIILDTPEHGRKVVHGPTKLGNVVLQGAPGELLLYGFGRRDQALVTMVGRDDAKDALHAADIGL